MVVNIYRHAFTHLYIGTHVIIDACEYHPIHLYMTHHVYVEVCPA